MKDLTIVEVKFVGSNGSLSEKEYNYKCEKVLVKSGDIALVSVHSNDISNVSRLDIVSSTKAVVVTRVYGDINDFIKSPKTNVSLEKINKHIISNITKETKSYQLNINREIEKEKAKELIEKRIQELDEVSKYKYILEQTGDKELEKLMRTAGFLD